MIIIKKKKKKEEDDDNDNIETMRVLKRYHWPNVFENSFIK